MKWFGLSFAPKPNCHERLARQYRHEPPPEFPLTLPFSGCIHHQPSPKTLSSSTFKIKGGCKCICPSIHFHCACSHAHTHRNRHMTRAQGHADTQTRLWKIREKRSVKSVRIYSKLSRVSFGAVCHAVGRSSVRKVCAVHVLCI